MLRLDYNSFSWPDNYFEELVRRVAAIFFYVYEGEYAVHVFARKNATPCRFRFDEISKLEEDIILLWLVLSIIGLVIAGTFEILVFRERARSITNRDGTCCARSNYKILVFILSWNRFDITKCNINNSLRIIIIIYEYILHIIIKYVRNDVYKFFLVTVTVTNSDSIVLNLK